MTEEIAIIIKAIDDFSKTNQKVLVELDKLNQKVEGLSKTQERVAKTTEQSKISLDDNIGSLIALGNAAAAVENIQSSLVSLNLRLENATERVANAQDRLTDAQTKLSRLQKSGIATADQLHDAEQELERATRGLTISQNNLARTQNQVVGTYISIGIQVLSLIRTLPTLIVSIQSLTAAGAAFALTPIGMTLIAIGAAIATVKIVTDEYKSTLSDIRTETEKIDTLNRRLADSYGYIERAQNEFLSGLIGGLDKASQKEINRLKVDQAVLRGKKVNTMEEVITINQRIEMIDREIARIRQAAEDKKLIAQSELGEQEVQSDLMVGLLKLPMQEYIDYLNSPEVAQAIQIAADWRIEQTKTEVDAHIKELNRLIKKQNEAFSIGGAAPIVKKLPGVSTPLNFNPVETVSRLLLKQFGTKVSI